MGILDAQQLPGLIFSLLDLKLTFHSHVGQTEEGVWEKCLNYQRVALSYKSIAAQTIERFLNFILVTNPIVLQVLCCFLLGTITRG